MSNQESREKCFKKFNNYHPNIKFTIEVNPSKFLDMEIMIKNGITETSVAINESQIPKIFINEKYSFNVIWKTRNARSFFYLNDKTSLICIA